MSRAVLKRTAGDSGDILTFNLQEADGSASDLTNQTAIQFHARLEGDVPGVDALRVDAAMTVVGPETGGVVRFTVASTHFTVAGLYYAQIEVVFAAPAKQVTWDIAIIIVEEQHG